MNNHKGLARYWLKFLIAAYQACGWLSHRFLSAAIKFTATELHK
jgi:hypothetical protein